MQRRGLTVHSIQAWQTPCKMIGHYLTWGCALSYELNRQNTSGGLHSASLEASARSAPSSNSTMGGGLAAKVSAEGPRCHLLACRPLKLEGIDRMPVHLDQLEKPARAQSSMIARLPLRMAMIKGIFPPFADRQGGALKASNCRTHTSSSPRMASASAKGDTSGVPEE